MSAVAMGILRLNVIYFPSLKANVSDRSEVRSFLGVGVFSAPEVQEYNLDGGL